MSVAFLAMSNHIKITHSADFFIELLRDFFGEVVVIAHEDAWLQLPGRKWDLIVVWQKRYKPEELEAFGADRVVLVPMYDDIPFDESYWGRYRSFKVLCFSRAMERMLLSFGLQAWGVRYYPEIPKTRAEWGGFRGFFWPRIKAIDWALVKRLVGGTAFDRMHVHWTGGDEAARRSLLAEDEAADSNVEMSSWVSDPSAYRSSLEAANVFFAPRLAEGIGLSFIEAMALGQCVVAADRPTMNEYIQDGLNGILYDPASPSAIDFSRAGELGTAARASCAAGRKAWLDALPDVRRFLEEPARDYRPRSHALLALKGKNVARLRRIPGLFELFRRIKSLGRG